MGNIGNKALKKIRKQIESLGKEKDIISAQQKGEKLIEEVLNTYGKEIYDRELETMFSNLRTFYGDRGQSLPAPYYPLAVQYAEILLERDNLRLAQDVVLSSASIVKDQNEIDEVSQVDRDEFKKLREEILKISALIVQQNEEKLPEVVEQLNEKLGRNAQFELFLKLTEEIDIRELSGEILAYNTDEVANKRTTTPTSVSTQSQRNPLPNYLLPTPRLKFIIHEAFKGRKIKVYRGIKAFGDYLIFEIEGLESVVAEKFFEKDKEGGHRIAEGRDATYIVPKEFVLDLQRLSKSELQEMRQIYPEIKRFNHRSGIIEALPENVEELDYDLIHYYRQFKTKFNGSVGYEYFEGFGLDEPNINKKIKGKRTRTGTLKKAKPIKEGDKAAAAAEVLQLDEQPIEVPVIKNDEKTEVGTLGEKERLSTILEEKITAVRELRERLKEACSRREDVTALSEKLKAAVAEMNKINEQIRSMED